MSASWAVLLALVLIWVFLLSRGLAGKGRPGYYVGSYRRVPHF